jgi:Transglutaminase-like superfamily
VVEHHLDTVGVTGSNPVSRTIFRSFPRFILNPAIHAAPPAPEELDALLRLLDDETPAVRERVSERLALYGGDISESLASLARGLTDEERELLIEMLAPPRREQLTRDWIVPSGGAGALREDWDTLEALLRTLSDFLHDGITLRQPLSDALDLLAEEAAEEGITTANELRAFLFETKRLVGNQEGYLDPRNSDLAWCLAEGRSNPLGLCLIFILTGSRMDLEIEGVNFPGHFMCRIFEDGFPLIVDCFGDGQLHVQATLLEDPELNRLQRDHLRRSADPGTILVRLLNNLRQSLEKADRTEDSLLVEDLLVTLG